MADPLLPALVALIMFGAAVIQGAVGFGFALIGVVALAFVVDPKTVVVVMSLVAPIVSSSQMWHHREHRRVVRRLGVVLATAAVGSLVGAQLLVVLPTWAVSVAMGLFALSYVFTAVRPGRPPLSERTERRLGPLVGFSAGVLNGSVGASGPIIGPYLHAIGLHVRDFAFAISSVFTLMSLVRFASFAYLGAYTTTTMTLSALIVVPALVGQRLGFVVQRRIDQRRFELAVLALLVLSGLNLLIKGAQGALGS